MKVLERVLTVEREKMPFQRLPDLGGHGFVDPGTAGYHPHAAELAWPVVVDFLERELGGQTRPS
ncbi:MAG: hypothetical protein HY695_11010 [Deltaproteobacteria bacterium]|nr:hypothetical protein [Deltaproteobacteria bacterium]